MFIANMAMSDLLFPIVLFPVRLTNLHVDSWRIGSTLGQALCKIHPFLADFSRLVSIQSLVLITVDRFAAVVVPLRSPLISRKVCRCLIVGTWILAAAFHWPDLLIFNLVEFQEGKWCVNRMQLFRETSSSGSYALSISIFSFYIPFVILVIFYSIILIKLKKQAHPGVQSASAEEQRTRRNRNVLKMAVAIVAAFFICWIPFSIQLVTFYFVPENKLDFCKFWVSDNVTLLIAYTSCAINPIICLTFTRNYRQALRRLVNCCDAVQG